MTDLFKDMPEHAMTPAERKKMMAQPKRKKRGHAWQPGTGPAGETCKGCKHAVKRGGTAGSYYKCALMRKHWTGGIATDILLRDPACREFEKETIDEPPETNR